MRKTEKRRVCYDFARLMDNVKDNMKRQHGVTISDSQASQIIITQAGIDIKRAAYPFRRIR